MDNTPNNTGPRTVREIVFDDMRDKFLRIELNDGYNLESVFGDAIREYKGTTNCVVGIPIVKNADIPTGIVLCVGAKTSRLMTVSAFQTLTKILSPVEEIKVTERDAIDEAFEAMPSFEETNAALQKLAAVSRRGDHGRD